MWRVPSIGELSHGHRRGWPRAPTANAGSQSSRICRRSHRAGRRHWDQNRTRAAMGIGACARRHELCKAGVRAACPPMVILTQATIAAKFPKHVGRWLSEPSHNAHPLPCLGLVQLARGWPHRTAQVSELAWAQLDVHQAPAAAPRGECPRTRRRRTHSPSPPSTSVPSVRHKCMPHLPHTPGPAILTAVRSLPTSNLTSPGLAPRSGHRILRAFDGRLFAGWRPVARMQLMTR
eukprot:scaffold83181_cov25-Tisochrysis_lutea.AAC.4